MVIQLEENVARREEGMLVLVILIRRTTKKILVRLALKRELKKVAHPKTSLKVISSMTMMEITLERVKSQKMIKITENEIIPRRRTKKLFHIRTNMTMGAWIAMRSQTLLIVALMMTVPRRKKVERVRTIGQISSKAEEITGKI